MRAMRSLQSHSNTEQEKMEMNLDTGYLIGIPDIMWEMCQGYEYSGRECGGNQNSSATAAFCCAVF